MSPQHANCLSGLTGISHGFFTRRGGVSQGLYASLNCGLGSGDDPAAVRQNRARVVARLGAQHVATAHQTHGTTTLIVDRPWLGDRRPQADALVTATPGMAVGVLTADCVPVLFADAQARVVAAAHAGWRGAIAGILESAIAVMEDLGATKAGIRAAVGPCIGVAAYEVGPEFEREFLQQDPDNGVFFQRPNSGGRPHFDLSGYVAYRLDRSGILHVQALRGCTYDQEEDFFSFRRSRALKEPDYGRQISAIVLT